MNIMVNDVKCHNMCDIVPIIILLSENGGQTYMLEKIMDLLAKQLRIDVNTLSPDTNIVEDLGADSLDIVEMLMAIEENFGITVSDEEAVTLKTIADVADFIEKKI